MDLSYSALRIMDQKHFPSSLTKLRSVFFLYDLTDQSLHLVGYSFKITPSSRTSIIPKPWARSSTLVSSVTRGSTKCMHHGAPMAQLSILPRSTEWSGSKTFNVLCLHGGTPHIHGILISIVHTS